MVVDRVVVGVVVGVDGVGDGLGAGNVDVENCDEDGKNEEDSTIIEESEEDREIVGLREGIIDGVGFGDGM